MTETEKKYSILDELAKCSGYDIALMTTFNFEISFFERAILNRLYVNNVKKVSLFVDSKELTKAIKEVDTSHIGRKYMVNPVQMPGSFHPKVILLLGENKARLFVGSANIKTSGYAINNEVFNFIDYTPEHPDYLDVIVAAINFFQDINEISYQLDNDILKEMKKLIYYHNSEKNGELYLIQNMRKSILTQVQEIIDGEVVNIRVAVPYYDNGLAALRDLKTTFPKADVQLYVQNEKSTFPIHYNEQHRIATHINIFDSFKDNSSGSSSNFYHGKLFLFITKEKSYMLYGSSNCTQSALSKSFETGGNIECDFFETGDVQDFDYFFENMKLQQGKNLVSKIMIFEKQESVNYIFKYGEAKEGLELHLGFSSMRPDLQVFIGEQELKFDISNQDLVVYVPEEYRSSLSDIFEIALHYADKKEILRCWTYSVAALEINRLKQSDKMLLDDFDMDSNGDKYIEDRCNLFKAELTCLPELLEYKKELAYYNQIKREQEGDDGESADFIVDVQIPDEYRVNYKQYNAASRIRDIFLRRFFHANPGLFFPKGLDAEKEYHDGVAKRKDSAAPRKATSAEKSFERFVKNKVKGMMKDAYVDIIETEHYIGLVMVVLDIFNKYNKVENIFDMPYVMRTKTEFFIKLLTKEIIGDDKERIEDAILIQCFKILLENYVIRKEEKDYDIYRDYDSINRSLLMAMEHKFKIRTSYENYLDVLMNSDDKLVAKSEMLALVDYIENLFGYKNYELLEKFITSVYDNAVIVLKGKTLIIKATSNQIQKHFKPDTNVIREIRKFSRCVSPVDSVSIIIDNRESDPKNKNEIVQRKHSVSFEYQNWKSSLLRKNGTVYNMKPMFLEF